MTSTNLYDLGEVHMVHNVACHVNECYRLIDNYKDTTTIIKAHLAKRLLSWEMESATQVQIVNKIAYVSLWANSLRKDMDRSSSPFQLWVNIRAY